MELEALQQVWPDIESLGAALVAVSPQTSKYSRKIIERHNLTFPVLSDPGNQIAKRFGLVFFLPDYLRELFLKFGADLTKFNGDESWTLPMPGRFVIRQDSIIVAADVDPDYTRRPEPVQIVAVLKSMGL